MAYFRKHWSADLVSEVEESVQARVSPLVSVHGVLLICNLCYHSLSNTLTVCTQILVQSRIVYASLHQNASLHIRILTTPTPRMTIATVGLQMPHHPVHGWLSGSRTSTLMKIFRRVWVLSDGGG
jgi:hypothetical protein